MLDNGKPLTPWVGEFKSQSDSRQCWTLFLAAIERVAAEVLQDLHQQVLPVFVATVDDDYELVQGGPGALSRERVETITGVVNPAIEEWARRFRMMTHQNGDSEPSRSGRAWLFETVYKTLTVWTDTSHPSASLEWAPPHEPKVCWTPGVWFSAPEWNVTSETRAAATSRMMAILGDQLREYLTRQENEAADAGLVKRPAKWEPDYFDWLVLYQVKGQSHNLIAQTLHHTRTTVAKGIKQAAHWLVGAAWKKWLRPTGKPGRPRRLT